MSKEKYYYIVSHTVSEYGSVKDGIFETFEEARALIPNLCNWYESKGSGRIAKINSNFKEVEVWGFSHNEVNYHLVK